MVVSAGLSKEFQDKDPSMSETLGKTWGVVAHSSGKFSWKGVYFGKIRTYCPRGLRLLDLTNLQGDRLAAQPR